MVHDRIVSETYLSVATQLEDRIQRLDAGAKVPSENEVVREFSVSRPTARAALQELERRFVVRRVKGSGTFVNERIPYPIGSAHPPSISRTLAASGRRTHLRLASVSDDEPSLAEASLFGDAQPRRLCTIGRTIEADDEVIGFTTSKVSSRVAPDIRRHIDDISSIWSILDSVYGIHLSRRAIDITFDTPPEYIARLVGTREPVWHLQSINVDCVTGEIVELGESWLRADRVAVHINFEHPLSTSLTDGSDDQPTPKDTTKRTA